MAMTPVRVAAVGCGYWGPNVIRNLYSLPGFELCSVCDIDAGRLRPIAQLYPAVRSTTAIADIFDDPSIDAVYLSTPVSTHYQLVKRALESGKHVLVEKPLATTVDQAESLAALAASTGLTLMVGHTFVFSPPVRKVKQLIEAGQIGPIYYIETTRVNLGLFQKDVSVLWDLGPHDVSIVLYWLGQSPEWVHCVGGCFVQSDIEDVVFLTMGFPSGAIAHAHLSWLAPSKLRTMTVIGDKKMALYDDAHSAEKVKVFDHGVAKLSADELRRSYRSGDIHSPHVAVTEALQLEVRHFIESIRDGTTPRSDGKAGVDVVRVLEAGNRSLRANGARISLKEPVQA
jgi:predicted dehydrogenase